MARLNDNGTPDTTFNHTGQVTTTFVSGYNTPQAIVLEKGGDILVGGQCAPGGRWRRAVGSGCYTSSGDLDPTLDIAGLELVPTVSGIDGIVGLAETTDGSIIALGQDFDAVKLDHGGFFDQSFGNNGIALNVASSAVGTSLALAPDGNIYAAGGTTYGSDSQMVISRLLSSGKLDNKFGTNGIVKVSLSGKSTVFAIALQDNGAIVAAGDVQNGLIANNVAVVRLVGSDTSPPVLVNPSVPALDPNSDTGMKGDGITAISRPAFIGTGADPGRLIILYDGSSSTILGTATANADGTYSVVPSTPLSVGSHSITVAEGDGQGFVGPRSGAFSVQITSQPISPTLVVVTHGQQFDPEALKTVALGVLSVIDSALAPIFLGSLSLDVSAGIPLTGSGRNGGEQFQFDIAQEVKDTLSTDLAGATTGVRRSS